MQGRLAKFAGLAFAFAAALLAACVAAPDRAEAAVSNCAIGTVSVAFSPYNSQTQVAVDSASTFTVTCTVSGNNSLNLRISGGNANSCTTRQMRLGTNNLGYQIYRDSGRANLWCNGTSTRQAVTFNFSGTGSQIQTQTFTIYGRVSAVQSPSPPYGSYSDSLLVALYNSSGTSVASTTASITGSVAAICTVSAGTLGFGAYSGTAVNAAATISVNCSSGAGYQVAMGAGSNQSGSARRMAGPSSNFLAYELYADSLRTTLWGDGSAQLGARRSGTGSGAAQSLTVYGRIPAGQSPAAGSYSDSVVVTIDY